jgi:hypothetical protein
MGIGPQLSDQAASDISRLWGGDAVHPLLEAYGALAAAIESDILTDDVRYVNPPKNLGGPNPKKPQVDISKSRQQWVEGCLAMVPRRTPTTPATTPSGLPVAGENVAEATPGPRTRGGSEAPVPASSKAGGRGRHGR